MVKCALVSGKPMGLRHGRHFSRHPEARLVAVCEMDPVLLSKLEAEFGVPGYATMDELLAECDAELILLIVNETRRIPPLRQLLGAGRNVFTEKPLCGMEGQERVREDDAAIAAPAIREWRDSRLKLGIDYNYRFMTHFMRLHDDVTSGQLGPIRMVHARAHFACWSHVIDQILWNMGLPEWVSALGDPTEKGAWTRLVRMKWPNGAIGALDGTTLWGGEENLLRLQILGEQNYAEAGGIVGYYRRAKAGAWQQQVAEHWHAKEGLSEMEQSFPRMADGVIKAMLADQPFPADGDAAWNELLFEAAVHRSARNDGRRVYPAELEKDLTARS